MRQSIFQSSSALLLCATLAVLLPACSQEDVSNPTNLAPETEAQASSPRQEDGGFAIDFSFSGEDPDGRVEFFEWRLLSDSLHDQAWTRSDERELSLFFADDPGDFGGDDAEPSRVLQVRAVDDRGLADPTAVGLGFTPLTLSPEIFISQPLNPSVTCIPSGRVASFRWTATDADSKSGAPAFIRFLLIPASQANGNCLTQLFYETKKWIFTNDPSWSPWIAYDPLADESDPSRGVALPGLSPGDSFLFAVQARDIDGATSRSFRWLEQVVHFQVTDSRFPILTVYETNFGQHSFVSLDGVRFHDISPGQDLEFSWSADAAPYLGEIDAYRYGWGLTDPNDPDDEGWAVGWGDWTSAPALSFNSGSPNFVVQTRDLSGAVSRATYEFSVVNP